MMFLDEIEKGAKKETAYLLNRLQRAGHKVEMRGSGHYMVKHSSGKGMVTMSSTPSDKRAYQNMVSQLRRNGFEVD